MELPLGEEFVFLCAGIVIAVAGVLVLLNFPGLSIIGIPLILIGIALFAIALFSVIRNR
ncbi:MAG: hypothetical protein LUQ40_02905 [Methanomicrobiales archaeon]|nr:hypothetical protein [Methanomicrobiales archaeon]